MITNQNFKKSYLIVFAILIVFLVWYFVNSSATTVSSKPQTTFWNVQSIDTMKYSRDSAGEALKDSSFDATIDQQTQHISNAGANYVAIATPYDDEFLPVLKRWIASARKYNLHIWFRGNWSGWEGWFNYPKIDRASHIQKTKDFIINNPDLFQNGDIFSACPECENGGPGDPRQTGDIQGFRDFLISEYAVTREAFGKIGVTVASNYDSMNYDVASLVMDPATTKKLDGVVTIDHYVADVNQMGDNIASLAQQSQGKIVIGEFGAPIPDIHGNMTEQQQAHWISQALLKLSQSPYVTGVNYWVSVGGSTAIWNDDGTPKKAVDAITKVYKPSVLSIMVKNQLGDSIQNANGTKGILNFSSNNSGVMQFPYMSGDENIQVSAGGYKTKTVKIADLISTKIVILDTLNESPLFKIRKLIITLFSH